MKDITLIILSMVWTNLIFISPLLFIKTYKKVIKDFKNKWRLRKWEN